MTQYVIYMKNLLLPEEWSRFPCFSSLWLERTSLVSHELLLSENVSALQAPAGRVSRGERWTLTGHPLTCSRTDLAGLGVLCTLDALLTCLHTTSLAHYKKLPSGMQNNLICALCCPKNPSRSGKGKQGNPELIASSSSASRARALYAVSPTCMAFLPSLQKCPWGVQHGDQRHLFP